MKRRSPNTAKRAGLLAVAAGLAAALAAAGARLAGREALVPRPRGRNARGRFERSAEQTFTCECGAEYRTSGTDRHRVYWRAGAPDDAPVLGDRCEDCGAPLPSGRASRPA